MSRSSCSGRTVGLLVFVLCACGGELPAPKVTSLAPQETPASSPVQLTAKVDAVLPFQANYGDRSGNVDTNVSFSVGPLKLYQGVWPRGGEFSVYLPSVLQPDTYDVVVGLSDGRVAIAKSALTVTPGQWPLSYAFDPIDAQRSGRPFAVHVQAVGGDAATFGGNLTLSSNSGDVQPTTTDAFTSGGLLQAVTVRGVTGFIQLTVRDSAGHVGISNSFQVQ